MPPTDQKRTTCQRRTAGMGAASFLMQNGIEEITNLLQHLERLLQRFELDVASRLYPLESTSAAIAALCLDFEHHMQSLANNGMR